MTELKTLKDITYENLCDLCGGQRMIHSQDLRLEAVKWVKFLTDDFKFHHDKNHDEYYANTADGMLHSNGCTRCWLMKFFNLSESDLK